jgi:hypothetical protein
VVHRAGLPALQALHCRSDAPSSLGSIHEVWGAMNTLTPRSEVREKMPLQKNNLMVEFDSPIMANTHIPEQKRLDSSRNTE